jgi:hypothetical protein
MTKTIVQILFFADMLLCFVIHNRMMKKSNKSGKFFSFTDTIAAYKTPELYALTSLIILGVCLGFFLNSLQQ